MLLSHGLHHVSWCRFRLQAGFSTVSVTSLLEATGFLRNRDSKNAILSFFLLLGSDQGSASKTESQNGAVYHGSRDLVPVFIAQRIEGFVDAV